MKITRIQFLIFGFIVLAFPMIIYKLLWLVRSEKATGIVLYVNTTYRYKNTYPVIQFETPGSVVKFSGHYNSAYEEGELVNVRYDPTFPLSCRIDNFWNIWIEVFLVDGMILIFWIFLFARNIISGAKFLISLSGIKSVH